ncbi:HNH endonuclease domain-containing protein [Flavobacterium sp.]|uniref:HNH endonuclease domain-containing protein n=1 Tax=Flavobacterium sp. TaxID=239 RepID=UPI0025FDF68A|nr:HNH endonuclease domain-containing protein [Flavobacterium sp.]
MASNYLSRLSPGEREKLIRDLWEIQNGKCFITEENIDLELHKSILDIDHVIPSKLGGKDDPSNFALTFASANRSKQASDLKLARILHRFTKIQNEFKEKEDRSPNLDDILKTKNGSKFSLKFRREDNNILYSLAQISNTEIIKAPIHKDKLSGLEYFFAVLPIEFVFHDDKINPRSIGNNISKLIDEFYQGNPQLHISLGWIDIKDNSESKVKIFDGQHKAAAQVMLDVKEIPVRIFINPNEDLIILTNFRAGTVLRQVAFDKSVQRHLGNTLYYDRVKRYQDELNLGDDNLNFSERELVNYFKGESRELKRYILDSVRDGVTRNPENKLMEFVDMGGRAKEKPISYSSIEKTFYSFFIYQDLLETPISHKLEEGNNPRSLEKEQIVQLMNIIAEEIYIGKFDLEIGTSRLESKIQNDGEIPMEHMRAYRMGKEEIMYNWLKYLSQIVQSHFISLGHPVDEKKLFQYEFSETLWNNIRNYINNLSALPLWTNNELSNTVFGGKQNYQFWHTIFTTGSSPQGVKVLVQPLNLNQLQIPRS